MAKYETHDFYCMNCGKKGISIPRKVGKMHGAFHRKKLWCPWCKNEVNHIECRTLEEVEEFKFNFENGVYFDEKEESLCYVRTERVWQEHLGTKANCSVRR